MVQERQITDAATFDAWVAGQPEERLFEFINGVLIEKPNVSNGIHSSTVCNLTAYLVQHLKDNDIDGFVTGATCGYRIGEQRYVPDGALILGQSLKDFYYSTNHPTLLIEMISHTTSRARQQVLDLKREIYLDAGITLWEGSTELRCVEVYTPDRRYRRVRDTLTLDALPGLAIPLGKVFRS